MSEGQEAKITFSVQDMYLIASHTSLFFLFFSVFPYNIIPKITSVVFILFWITVARKPASSTMKI